MTRKEKVCMLGATGVGKTSLVSRFVVGLFSEKYLTTVGVKVDRKTVEIDGTSLSLMLWDLEGEDQYADLRTRHLAGATGALVVADGTRRSTLFIALELAARAREVCGDIPVVLVINKADLTHLWEVRNSDLVASQLGELSKCIASAKTGQGVEDAFRLLASQMLTQ